MPTYSFHEGVLLVARQATAVLIVLRTLLDPLNTLILDSPESIGAVETSPLRWFEASDQLGRVERSFIQDTAFVVDEFILYMREKVPLEHD